MSQTESYLPARKASIATEAYKQILDYKELLEREEGQTRTETSPPSFPISIVSPVQKVQEAIDTIIESGNKSFILLVEDTPEGNNKDSRVSMVRGLKDAEYSVSSNEDMSIVEISW